MKTPSNIISALFLAAILVFAGTPALADTAAGAAIVETLHDNLLEMMRTADSLGFAGRVEAIHPVLLETFDFSTISRIVTGSHWKTLDEQKQGDFENTFAQLSAATYASNFSAYSGEQFTTLSAEEKRGNLLVKTALITGDGERVSLDYVLRKGEDSWGIVNVIAQGVSDLSLKRADYTAVIKNEGFDSLVAKLNDKISNYRSNGR